MIYEPYPDELRRINEIRKIRNDNYALIRVTPTMIDKNIIDANGLMRQLLKDSGLLDFDDLLNGGSNGVSIDTLFIKPEAIETITLSFYKVENQRGDPRFSIPHIRRRYQLGEISVNDLLYFAVAKYNDGSAQFYVINLTYGMPDLETISNALGADPITDLFNEIKPQLINILESGSYPNAKGPGKVAPKDVGDTLESIIGVSTNNRRDADIDGLIEIKSKGSPRTLNTLFSLRPNFEGTRLATIEPNDRFRVSAVTRYYGYFSDAHPGYKNLYITVGTEEAPQNNQGFSLHVDDTREKVNLIWTNPNSNASELVGYWTFDQLRNTLYQKHPSTLWVTANTEFKGDTAYFDYVDMEFSRAPQFSSFLSLIKSGAITYDWRGYTSTEGTYTGKNHGNSFRIKKKNVPDLFGEIEKVNYIGNYKN